MTAKTNLGALLPPYFTQILDFKSLVNTENIEFDNLKGNATQVHDNMFVQLCDTATLAIYEKLLNIIVQPDDTTAFRRERILSRLNSNVPYTIIALRQRLNTLLGAGQSIITVDPSAYSVSIVLLSGAYGVVQEVDHVVSSWLPAHLIYSISQTVPENISGSEYFGSTCGGWLDYDLKTAEV